MYRVFLAPQAEKDLQKILRSPLQQKLYKLMGVLEQDPFRPPYEKLSGDLSGAYSRRINIQHRLVYEVDEAKKTIKILRMWTHYE